MDFKRLLVDPLSGVETRFIKVKVDGARLAVEWTGISLIYLALLLVLSTEKRPSIKSDRRE